MKSWVTRVGQAHLRSFADPDGHLWIEQNPQKRSKWAKLARAGHEVAWEFESEAGPYTGRMLVDGELLTPSEATKKFFRNDRGSERL
jgi:hypothetical protein